MRGRSLIKEPSGSSICAFCAHRLGAARRPSHVQRRFLQSSRPSLKPPAAGEALRENNDESSRSRAAAPSWGGGVTWGQPTWGASTSDGNKSSSGEPTRPSHAEQDLLPHEIRARQLILDSQKRKVSIRTGFGPENTRSGRPMPKARTPRTTQAERLDIARAATLRRKERDEFHARTRQSGDILPRRIMDSRHTLGDIDPPTSNAAPTEETNKASQWTNLKRRGDDQVVSETSQTSQSTPPRDDPFIIARAQRLEEAKSQNYTPLGSRSVPPPLVRAQPSRGSPSWGIGLQRQSNARGDDAQLMEERKRNFERNDFSRSQARPDMPPERRTVGTRRIDLGAPIPEGNEAPKESISHFKVMRDGGMDGERGQQRSGEERRPVDSRESQNQEERRFMEFRKREYQSSEKERRPMDSRESQNQEERRFMEVRSSRKPPARFAAPKASSEVMPKGRGRDKARRREQFLADGEENEDDIEEARHRAELKRQRKREKEAKKAAAPVPILLPEYITVSNLAMALKVRVENFLEKLEELGYEETGTDFILNAEDSGLIAMEYNYEAIIDRSESEDLKPREPATDPSELPPRPPVVTIMGHVDHGKTTLLDWLRKSSVAASEHGGITQHIGAFSVPMPSGKIITFLDTPGHSAFESMRKRGANVTDIVILVVAADDSVKPQTIEAIKHAKAAKVPIIVAINKIDKEEKNVERVKQDLARHGVDVEDFGGDTQVVCVSGKTGQGMEDLEEAASTLSEILDMRAEIDGQAEGWVLEASIKSMGKVATVLVRRGTMRPGDFIVAGKTWARIRCLRNEAGVEIDSAGPGTPVEIDGWREQPEAGDEVLQAPDESKAKSVVDYRLENEERNKMAEDMEAINEFRKAEQDKRAREKEEARLAAEAEAAQREYVPETADAKPTGPKEIPFIIKGDVSGSVEAVVNNISLLGNKEVQPLILRSGVGQVSEFDIEHAAAAKGHIISFNTSVDPHISQLAERNKVTIIDQNIIYRLVDDVRAELSTHLSPLITQRVLGEAEIAQIFEITVKGRQQKNIAGCKIRNGTVARNAKVRVLRNNEKVFDGSLASLKNVKKDVQEMKKGSECGMGFDNWFDFQVGDLIQSYEEKHEKRYL